MGTQTSKPPDAAIARLAARQHGNITCAQLHALGLSKKAIARRVARGWLHKVHRGVYAVGRPPRTPLERAAAAVLACGATAALSHGSALALWGFAERWEAPLHVTSASDRRHPGIVTHQARGLTRADIRTQLGIRVTSPARTILDCAPGLPKLTRVVNDALHSPFLTHAQLADVRRRSPTHVGAKLLDPFLSETDGLTRSGFEDDFLGFCERFGLPRPSTNTRVAGHVVDALFADRQLIVELDGWEFHHDREAFETDRDRDADTLAAGLKTVRITYERLRQRPEQEADRLRKILAGGSVGAGGRRRV